MFAVSVGFGMFFVVVAVVVLLWGVFLVMLFFGSFFSSLVALRKNIIAIGVQQT